MSKFINTRRVESIDDLYNKYPYSEQQTYFTKKEGLYFKDMAGQRLATIELNYLNGAPNFENGKIDALKGRMILVRQIKDQEELFSIWFVEPESGIPKEIISSEKGVSVTQVEFLINEAISILRDDLLGMIGDIIEDKAFIHSQDIASGTWEIKHNLNKYPSVTVVDSAESVVYGEIVYIDKNNLKVIFSSGFGGKAYLN